jgi:hypothetical protein
MNLEPLGEADLAARDLGNISKCSVAGSRQACVLGWAGLHWMRRARLALCQARVMLVATADALTWRFTLLLPHKTAHYFFDHVTGRGRRNNSLPDPPITLFCEPAPFAHPPNGVGKPPLTSCSRQVASGTGRNALCICLCRPCAS